MRDRTILLAVLAVSMATNVYLAVRLRQRPAHFSDRQTLEELQRALGQLEKTMQATSKTEATAGIALRLGDCAPCFNFLSSFASLCEKRQGGCTALLVGGTTEQARQIAERFDLPFAVEAVSQLPEELADRNTPLVWVRKGDELTLLRDVPPQPQGQVHLLLELSAALW